MRALFAAASLWLASILPAAAAAEIQPTVDSAKTLVDDPYYVTEGAVTSFRTCLGVANDHRAMKLWDSDDPKIAAELDNAKEAESRDLVTALQGVDRQVKLSRGFGTIYACAQLAGAWLAEGRATGRDARMSDNPDWQDGRRRHGTVVIDLAMGESHYRRQDRPRDPKKPLVADQSDVVRGTIEAIPLVRILTSPRLLPPRDFGGVVIRNAEIDGALLFYNVHLELPLAFANVQFRGDTYEKGVFGDDEDPPVLDTAIAIVNSRFSDHVEIAASEICGHVRLIDSRFAESVSFRRVRQYGISCAPNRSQPDDPIILRVNTSTFEQGMSTIQATFGGLHVSASRIQSFASSRSHFGRYLNIKESDIGSLQINCSTLAREVDISYNQIAKDLFIYGSRSGEEFAPHDQTCFDWWRTGPWKDYRNSIKITSNRIGGGIGIGELDGAFLLATVEKDGTIKQPVINLASNRVGNGSMILLPTWDDFGHPWHGEVNLEGSSYEGRLDIGVADGKTPTKQESSEEDEPAAPSQGLPAATPRRGYCTVPDSKSRPPAMINLKAARIRTFAWNLPFTCHYRWTGYGLTYDLWLAGDDARSSAGIAFDVDDQDILNRWRETLARYESASLDAMSRYLAEKGAYVDSRAILLEAKRLNYAPSCRPDSYAFSCVLGLMRSFLPDRIWPFFARTQNADGNHAAVASSSTQHQEASESRLLEKLSWLGDWSGVWSVLMLFLLWPGGYGASPERALIWIGILAGVFCAIYWRYSRRLKRDLTSVPAYPNERATIKTSPLESAAAESDHPRELRETQSDDGFVFDAKGGADETLASVSQPAKELILPWPTEDEWKELNPDERLTAIQDILLPSIKVHADKPEQSHQQDDLRILSKQLERFGNTETLGFSLFDRNRMPTRFTHWLYSVDTMLPFIDLHAYGNYYAESGWIRAFSVVQHVLGWWLITVFIASAAIL